MPILPLATLLPSLAACGSFPTGGRSRARLDGDELPPFRCWIPASSVCNCWDALLMWSEWSATPILFPLRTEDSTSCSIACKSTRQAMAVGLTSRERRVGWRLA